MAKKKRVTLPKDFREMVETGNIEELKAVYDQCELHATYDGKYGMSTALHCYHIPDALVRWLVEQGLDINIENYYGRTPLYEQSTIISETANLLLELGADIEKPDRYGSRPLHNAANYLRVGNVRLLIEHGANIHAENDKNQTPLASALAICRGGQSSAMAAIAKLLLDAGAAVTPNMIESVKRIGEEFEFHRENFNKDCIVETEAGLSQLYTLFGVSPVARRQMHDGSSPIQVPAGSCKEQFTKLWELLIPSSGPAKTVQGEVVRIAGCVEDELSRNGGVNWDKEYRKMLDALLGHFASGTPLAKNNLAEAEDLVHSIRARGDYDEDATDRLSELAVIWVSANPNPMPLGKTNYKR